MSALPLALADVHADHGHEVSETLGLQDLQAQQEIERLSIDDVSPRASSRRPLSYSFGHAWDSSRGPSRDAEQTSRQISSLLRVVRACALLTLLLALQPWPAWAQAGWYYLPTLRLTEEFDDNVFSSVRRSSDFITRLTSDVKVGYRSTPFTLLLTGSADGEVFARNPELDGVNRTQSGLETEWRPVQPLTLRLGASSWRAPVTPVRLTQ